MSLTDTTTERDSDQRGTAEEAQALVGRAIAHCESAGQQAAFAAFAAANSGFRHKDLYVFVLGPDRKVAAHGGNAALVGLPADTLIDVDGVPFASNFLEHATEAGSWMAYKWQDPISNEVQAKSSWIVRHQDFVFGVGIYKV
jgi:cytochrome c